MRFADAVAIVRRHKLLVTYGLLMALTLAAASSYHVEGTKLVGRSAPAYQTTAVVAVTPGAEQPTTTVSPPSTVPAPTTVAVDPNGAVPASTPAETTTTVNAPPLAPLDDVIDSRGMYYTALSLKTVVVSPGFAEAVHTRVPDMDGSVTAVVAQDTNTIDIVADGSTAEIASDTMAAALVELQRVVTTYATTPASRFIVEGVVVSAASTPRATSSIKDPLTFVLVLVVALVLWWFAIRAVDAVQLQRRARRGVDDVPTPPLPPPNEPASRNGHGDRVPETVATR